MWGDRVLKLIESDIAAPVSTAVAQIFGLVQCAIFAHTSIMPNAKASIEHRLARLAVITLMALLAGVWVLVIRG